jgi:hypothetical protein
MTAVEYISDTEEIAEESCVHSQHDSAAVLKLSDRSPWLLALSATNLSTGDIQIIYVCQIMGIDRHSAECPEDCV